MSQRGTLPLERPWTEEEVINLLKVAYSGDGVTEAEAETAAREALANEGTAVELGTSGRRIAFMPGARQRLGLC